MKRYLDQLWPLRPLFYSAAVFFGLLFNPATLLAEPTSDMYEPTSDMYEPGQPVQIELREKGTDVYYLDALLGESAAELLFDTGSGYLALNGSLMETLEATGQARYQRSIRARLASGRIDQVPVYRLTEIQLGDNCILHNVDAVKLRGTSRNILGMNVLKQVESFQVSLKSHTLTLEGCGTPSNLTAGL